MARPLSGEIFFEHRQVGNVMRVAAICAVTGLEVVVVGPTNAPQKQLESIALQKLRHRAKKLRDQLTDLPGKGIVI